MNDIIYKFEKAGLVKAPFKVIGVYDEGQRNYDQAQYHSSCNYCYAQIRYIFEIESSDGKKFIVGSDCVKKTGDKGLINRINQEIAKVRYEKEEERIKNAKELL